MITAEGATRTSLPTRSPTEYLLGEGRGELSAMAVYRLITKGFSLKDLLGMLSLLDPVLVAKVISRTTGKSARTIQRLSRREVPVQLTAHQSAIALQYAKVLERALNVFGTMDLVQSWLSRPCNRLDGEVPLNIIDSPLGFQAVQDYLERIEYGLYQ